MQAQCDMRRDRMRDANATRESAHHDSLIRNCRRTIRSDDYELFGELLAPAALRNRLSPTISLIADLIADLIVSL